MLHILKKIKKSKIAASTIIYTISFLFGVSFSLVSILIPLYGLAIGYSATKIGILLSIPGISQIFLRLFAGVLSDYLGEKSMFYITFSNLVIASFVFTLIPGFWAMAVAQLIMGISRAIFWPISQSYTSRISISLLGKLSSFTFIGQAFGFLCGGWLIMNIGFTGTFGLLAIIGAFGLIITAFLMPILPRKYNKKRVSKFLKTVPKQIKSPKLVFGIFVAFLSGIIFMVAQSFFPIWLIELDFSEGWVGSIYAFTLSGYVIAGFLFSRIYNKLKLLLLLQLSLMGTGISFIIVMFVFNIAPAIILNLTLGIFSGLVSICYQNIAVAYSSDENRGLALSIVGLGWSLAMLIGPALFGSLVDTLTVTIAFSCLGISLIILSLFIKNFVIYRNSSTFSTLI